MIRMVISPLFQKATVLFSLVLSSCTHVQTSLGETGPPFDPVRSVTRSHLACRRSTPAHLRPSRLTPALPSAHHSDRYPLDPTCAPASASPRPQTAGARPVSEHDPLPPTAAPGPPRRSSLDPPLSRASLGQEPASEKAHSGFTHTVSARLLAAG